MRRKKNQPGQSRGSARRSGIKGRKFSVIGNSPTALFQLKKFIEEKKVSPSLIIGVPVGFVGAAESKEEIKKAGVPYIVTNGRKGGSTVAVAIVNALLKMEV